ncbi:hypothetical protein [Gordonia soli]|uniref:Polysaccharide biosynthesis protein n=1 Tax=Gordonia soli NBRC 108243 TaxID=1223545 RepID=M0QGJ3_9ACTN|nr:hypothetical protein [Gordonia soli]GAC67569.1 hypothetical protein GS4_08_01540 [Gordonia soli NBRC 108243]
MTGPLGSGPVTPDADVPAASGVTGGAIGRVTIATAVAAVSGYLVLLLAARHLGAAGYGAFAVFWAAYGMVTGAQNGQLQETTRSVRAGSSAEPGTVTVDAPVTARPLVINTVIGLGLALLVLATAPLWSGRLVDDDRALSVGLLAVGVASFAVYAHLAGACSGAMSWNAFAILLSVDAMIRLVGAVLAVALGAGLTAFLVITVVGSVSWIVVVLAVPSARRVIGLHADVGPRRLAANTLTAMAAAAASAILVMGFPVLIDLVARPTSADAAILGAVVLAVTLTRAPLLVPLNSFQGVLIARFVDQRATPLRALRIPLAAVTAIGLVGAVAAWAIGPWLLRSVFGSGFDLGGLTVGALTVGATTLAALTVTGAATIAVGAHRWYATGWWLATGASIALLALPVALTTAVSVALIGGPVIGMTVHLVAVLGRRRVTSSGHPV